MSEFIEVVYGVKSPAAEVESRAESILLEQAVELPRKALTDPFVLSNIVGEVRSIERRGEGDYRVTIAHPAITAAENPAQLLNVFFGNTSLQPDVLLEDLRIPASLLEKFRGPRFGIEGLRQATHVSHGPLTSTALKPMGLSVEKLADICRTFALAGVDLIKDDHGLADHAFSPFRERVKACVTAVRQAAEKTGRETLYVPNLIGTPTEVLEQLRFAQEAGVGGVMISPMLLGLPLLNEIVRGELRVPLLAHPSFGGALRIAPEALLGRLFRWFGADAVIYPNHGGRFSYSLKTCETLASRLRDPNGGGKTVLPVPAGGIKVERLGEILAFYGEDVMLLIGGSLYEARESLEERTREFVTKARGL
jgi:ribulose-bisphosphate carboxylase large chain